MQQCQKSGCHNGKKDLQKLMKEINEKSRKIKQQSLKDKNYTHTHTHQKILGDINNTWEIEECTGSRHSI